MRFANLARYATGPLLLIAGCGDDEQKWRSQGAERPAGGPTSKVVPQVRGQSPDREIANNLSIAKPLAETEIKQGEGVGRAVLNLRKSVNDKYPNTSYPPALKYFMKEGNHFQFAEKNLPKTLPPGVLAINSNGTITITEPQGRPRILVGSQIEKKEQPAEFDSSSEISAELAPAARSNKVIVIDAGHGGPDSGATRADVYEKDINLAVAKEVQRQLQEQGYTVFMTRTDDKFVPLSERTKFSNGLKPKAFVSIHTNSTKDEVTSARGIEIRVTDARSFKKGLNAQQSAAEKRRYEASLALARSVDIGLQSGIGKGDRNGQYENQNLQVCMIDDPAMLVEVGFINHPDELNELQSPEHQERLATSIVNGITKFVGKP